MTAAPIAFQSNTNRYKFEGTSQLINAYAEKQGADGKAPLAVMPSDALVAGWENGGTPCRGMIYLEDLGVLYSVHGSSVWKVLEAGTSTRIGTIPGNAPVQLSRNQAASPQVTVRCDAGVLVIESDSVSFVLDADVLGDVVTAENSNNYTLLGLADRRWQISGINSSKVYDALDFATFEQKAGKLIRIKENNGEVVGFCSTWIEFWRNITDPDFPFSPIGFKSRGLMAANAVIECDNTLMFPGDDGIFYRLNNYDPARISTHHIEDLIKKDTAQSSLLGFGWARGGHAFAALTGTNWTRVYDAASGVWHSRESYGQDKWRAQYAVQAWGKTILGDNQSGKLFYLDSDTYTEDGGTMVWGVDSPPLHAFPNGGVVNAVHFDMATGYGTLTGQGVDPKVMLSVSKDGGATFQQYREVSIGARGAHQTRVTFRRLGKFGVKGIVFRLRISDPVARALVAVDVDVEALKL